MIRHLTDTIDRVLDGVNVLSRPGPGITRPSYDPLESRAHAVIAAEAERLGLTVERDAALNLYARLPGQDRTAPALYMGSHLDSVPNGGAYDGPAGVAGAVALASALVKRGTPPPVDLVVTVTRAEESVWFPASYIGSRSATGRLTAEDMAVCRSDSGRSLADHMRDEGGDPDAVLRGPGLSPALFIEPHIEQGPVLDEAGEPFALVTAIRGGLRYRNAGISGTWAHSGGAPRHSRSDTVFALADLVTAMDRHWATFLEQGHDLAVTVGKVDAATPEHAFAKVPGALSFCLDLRSDDPDVLDRADALVRAEVAAIDAARGTTFDLGPQSRSAPTPLSLPLIERLDAAFARHGRPVRRMLSGGGHDAAAFTQAGWTAGMLFIRNQNGSHNADEAMDSRDLALAIDALAASLAEACAP